MTRLVGDEPCLALYLKRRRARERPQDRERSREQERTTETLDGASRHVRPQERSGVVVSFPIRRSHAALVKLTDSVPVSVARTAAGSNVVPNHGPLNVSRLPLNNVPDSRAALTLVQRMDAARLAPAGKREAMPDKLEPMHAELADAPFNRADWMWEPKLDGYRVVAFVGGQVKLRSRRGLELAKSFPALASELAKQGASMVLDGEIVAFDEQGKPSFNALQNRFQLKTAGDIAAAEKSTPVMFYAFDLVHFAGVDLRQAPYADRRRYLSQCLLPSALVRLVHATEDGVELYAAALASGFEGVIGKRKQSKYEAGKRSSSWVKVKSTRSAEFVVGGYTRGKGSREPLGALLVGTWEGRKLRYASHVGSGFDERTLSLVQARLRPLQRKTCPFAQKPELNAPATWVEPEVVVEVKFQGWTGDGSLRAPVFLRLRDDVDPKAITRKEVAPAASARSTGSVIDDVLRQLASPKASLSIAVGPHELKLTHLDRVCARFNELRRPDLIVEAVLILGDADNFAVTKVLTQAESECRELAAEPHARGGAATSPRRRSARASRTCTSSRGCSGPCAPGLP